MAWFTAEHRVLMSAPRSAAMAGSDARAWQLARALATFPQPKGTLTLLEADPAETTTHLRRALSLHAQVGDHIGQAATHCILGYVYEQQGRIESALDQTRQALTLYEAAGDVNGHADALNTLGWHLIQLGDPTTALPHCERALGLLQRTGDRARLAT
jgi:tetratricopeptide (TPR) repeat protein